MSDVPGPLEVERSVDHQIVRVPIPATARQMWPMILGGALALCGTTVAAVLAVIGEATGVPLAESGAALGIGASGIGVTVMIVAAILSTPANRRNPQRIVELRPGRLVVDGERISWEDVRAVQIGRGGRSVSVARRGEEPVVIAPRIAPDAAKWLAREIEGARQDAVRGVVDAGARRAVEALRERR